MPTHAAPTAVAANGKKTLSSNEVLAYSKNRFVEHNLRHRMQHLSDQEQVCHDRHQQERVRWRHFMRQSSKTTGLWSVSLCQDQDLAPESEEQDLGAAERPVEDPVPQKPSPRGNPSTELARSLMFRNEALSQLQKPWVYSYSEESHNALCKVALEVARVKERRLLFRRAASAITPRSLPDNATSTLSRSSSPRALSSRGQSRQQRDTRTPRPLTGRSTPGLRHKSASGSPHRLTASASVHKNRPKTSVGVVRVTQKPSKVAWVDVDGNDRQGNAQDNTDEVKDTEPASSPASACLQDRAASQHVTTVYRFTESGESVEIASNKEKSPKEVKLPTVKRRKHGVVVSPEQLLQGREDYSLGTSQGCDTADAASEHVNTQFTQHTNQQEHTQTHDERSNQQSNNDLSDDGEAASHVNRTGASGTVDDTSEREQQKKGVAQGVAVWKRRAALRQSNSSETSEPQPPPSRHPVTLPEDQPSDSTPSTTHEPSPSDPTPSRNLAENQDPPSSENPEGTLPKPENQYRPPKSESQEDKQQTSVTEAPSAGRLSDWRPRPAGQRVNGAAEHQVAGIHAVPVAHAAIKRRGSFMKIVEQLEALRAGGRRRSVRVDDDPEPQPEGEEVSQPENDPAANTANDTAVAAERDTRRNARRKFSIETTAVAAVTTIKDRQTDSKTASRKLDKIEEDSHPAKPVSDQLENQGTEAPSSALDEDTNKLMMEFHSEHLPLADLDEDEDFYPPNVRSVAGSDCTTFKGYKIRNYVRPQLRYRADPFLSSRREKSLIRLSMDYPLYLNGYRGDLKSQMLFPKTCRQKVLQELVHRNNQPLPVQDSGVVPPELRAKIDEFFKTIEHYFPKPEIVLD